MDFADEKSRDQCITKSKTFVANRILGIEAWRTEDEATKIVFSRVPTCIPDGNLTKYARMWGTLVLLDGQPIQRNMVGGHHSKMEREDGTRHRYIQLN